MDSDTTPTAILGTNEDVVWLAGLLEGEGTFDAHRRKYPRIRLGMTDRDVVGRAASLMGCGIRLTLKPAPMSPTFHAEISGERAARIMRELLPHMGARRSGRIAEVLSIHATRTGKLAPRAGGGSRSTPGPSLGRPLGIAKPQAPAA
ncbi:endonuclease [Microbacterium phage Zeta1847]|uniref:Endonuclease n=1 Tax=Microbacterium phage Zeta1847 TaxID=2201444 RepID=A0A2Z4Q9I0_9CAUD|nr:HNH endonuclease [Microbacterium phage Zeta1847]AWY06664.1 endonuclease [Microbacterium phage Zeta1847]